MSKKGKDFHEGGLYIEKASKEKIYLDDITEPGDVIYFNAEVPHGVDIIDLKKLINGQISMVDGCYY